jgi:hypothetical protein
MISYRMRMLFSTASYDDFDRTRQNILHHTIARLVTTHYLISHEVYHLIITISPTPPGLSLGMTWTATATSQWKILEESSRLRASRAQRRS